jgi:hypothetical protein
MLAEIAQPVGTHECGRGCRKEDLPAVAARGDAGRTVDVDTDVAAFGQVGRAGVNAYAHSNGAPGKSLKRSSGRSQRTRRGRKRDEEGVPLGIDLYAAVGAERLA